MLIQRKPTKNIFLGGVGIGNERPISIQSMTTTSTQDIQATLTQISELKEAGADIVRLSVLNERDADALHILVKETPLPLVADIHYRADLAIMALRARIHGLRINPGNLSEQHKVKEIVEIAKEYYPPIRIGVNGGSLDRKKYPETTPETMVESALDHIKILEDLDYTNIKVSLKSSDIMTTVAAYRLFAKQSSYPIHLGVTEAGDLFTSSIRSSAALGTLLMEGIGDTIRISVSGNPVIEPKIAKELLTSLRLSKGLHIIGCPTCGRKNIDVENIILLLREKTNNNLNKNISIAIMGCVVNGFGEAEHVDIGVVGIHGATEIYKQGKLYKKLPSHTKEKDIVEEILNIISIL